MLDLTLGYEVLIQPVAFAAAVVYALYQLVRGFSREAIDVDGIEVKKVRWDSGGLRRAAIGLGVGILFVLSTVVVPFGHRGVVWSSVGGVDFDERAPGVSLILPIIQSDVIMDVREKRYATVFKDGHEDAGKANAFVQSKDLQEITVRASLVYQVNPDQAAELYDQVGPEYEAFVIEPIFFDAIKEASGQRIATDFAEQLGPIADDIEAIVTPQLEQRGIRVINVSLEDAVFDKEFIAQIKANEIALQKQKESERLVTVAQNEAAAVARTAEGEEQRRLIEARGERQAIEDIASALGFTPEEYLDWLLLTRWDGVLPTTLVGSSAGLDILLGIPK